VRPIVGRENIEVYCDMTIDGGGWTLVARSTPGKSASKFGWRVNTGAVRNDDAPYSLDAQRLATFQEILFGARADAKVWASPYYMRKVGATFLGFKDGAAPRAGSVGLMGCATGGGADNQPTMLSLAGWTNIDDHFAFTDATNTNSFGLDSEKWSTNGNGTGNCQYDGLLTDLPGMIFVR
jgi:hypothetical protein